MIETKKTSLFQIITHIARGRWLSFFASLAIMATAGAGKYCFGFYSTEINSLMGYRGTRQIFLGLLKDLGANIGVLSGLIAEVTPPWLLLLIGPAINFGSFMMIWMSVTEKVTRPKYWQMGMYVFLGANSHNFVNTAVLVTCVTNFPEKRGVLLGILKGFSGLSGAIIMQIYLALYGHQNPKSLVLLVAWLPAAICISFVRLIRIITTVRQKNEAKVLYKFLYTYIALALFLITMTILEVLVKFSRVAYVISGAIASFLLFVPLAIAIKEEIVTWKQKKESMGHIIKTIQKMPKWCYCETLLKPSRGEDHTILQALLSIDMMILFASTMCGFGASLKAIVNLNRIGESLGYPKTTVQTFVYLVTVWNYFGRIFAGVVSEKLITKYKCPRPLMTTLVMFLSCIGHLLIAFPTPGSVYMASIIIGFSFGAHVSVLNAIISELFGLKHYATLFNVGQIASPLGSYILNIKIVGPFYDEEALKWIDIKNLSEELICFGKSCFKAAFVNLACVTFLAALVSILLVIRTRDFYEGDIYKKFRVGVEEEEEEVEIEIEQTSSA